MRGANNVSGCFERLYFAEACQCFRELYCELFRNVTPNQNNVSLSSIVSYIFLVVSSAPWPLRPLCSTYSRHRVRNGTNVKSFSNGRLEHLIARRTPHRACCVLYLASMVVQAVME